MAYDELAKWSHDRALDECRRLRAENAQVRSLLFVLARRRGQSGPVRLLTEDKESIAELERLRAATSQLQMALARTAAEKAGLRDEIEELKAALKALST